MENGKGKIAFAIVVCLFAAQLAFASGGGEAVLPVEVTWLAEFDGDPADNIPVQKAQELFNVRIKLVYCGMYDREKYNMILASGDVPDAFEAKSGYVTLYENELIRPIEKADIVKNIPEYETYMSGIPGGWKMAQAPGKKDS